MGRGLLNDQVSLGDGLEMPTAAGRDMGQSAGGGRYFRSPAKDLPNQGTSADYALKP